MQRGAYSHCLQVHNWHRAADNQRTMLASLLQRIKRRFSLTAFAADVATWLAALALVAAIIERLRG